MAFVSSVPQARSQALDMFRVLCAMMVVGIHTHLFQSTSPVLGQLLTNGIFRLAVPFFFVLSGYYFYDKVKNVATLKVWFIRLLGLYAFWMLLYFPFYGTHDMYTFLVKFAFGYYHLWYILGLIEGGLLLYVSRSLPLRYVLAAALGLFAIGLGLQFFLLAEAILGKNFLYRNGLFFSFPLMLCGYVLASRRIQLSAQASGSLAMAGLVGIMLESQLLLPFVPYRQGVDLYVSLPVACVGIFLFLQQVNWRYMPQPWPKFWVYLASSIYFAHIAFVNVIEKLWPAHLSTWGLAAGIIGGGLAVIPLSLLARRFRFVL